MPQTMKASQNWKNFGKWGRLLFNSKKIHLGRKKINHELIEAGRDLRRSCGPVQHSGQGQPSAMRAGCSRPWPVTFLVSPWITSLGFCFYPWPLLLVIFFFLLPPSPMIAFMIAWSKLYLCHVLAIREGCGQCNYLGKSQMLLHAGLYISDKLAETIIPGNTFLLEMVFPSLFKLTLQVFCFWVVAAVDYKVDLLQTILSDYRIYQKYIISLWVDDHSRA